MSFQRSRMQGAVSIEYALVASLIALVISVGLALVGAPVEAVYGKIAACFADPRSGSGGKS